MAARSTWEGYLRLNLLSVPVKAYSATVSGRGKIGFHQIHAKCHSRIRYKKTCPIHGEVPNDEIVSGYEVARGQYVLVDKEALANLRADVDKAINIDVFIRPEALEPVYYTDRTYYLVPDGEVGAKSYAVIRQVMADDGRYAVAMMVLSGRAQVVLIRPVGRLLAVTVLSYDTQLKKPTDFDDEVPVVSAGAAEVKLARSLVEASTADEFDFAKYQDDYTANVRRLVESKAAKHTVIAEADGEEPAVINLMEALRESLHEAKAGRRSHRQPGRGSHRPARPRPARPRRKAG
jgi:DNA end-binding protein Ku